MGHYEKCLAELQTYYVAREIVVVKSFGFGARYVGFESWLFNLLALRPCANHLTSLCLRFLVYKMRIILISYRIFS